ncbi:hypothetical protein LAZ67_1005356 [Cordylochernes scorpioides]|uniref:DUF5641 domain-containing protein n=1 Tax=Cordylochernes scorpioides TaxID=51811 RepID=A0ABY6JYD9_9ARAC|nr:hypothetical protein LAZ67_1005356 [Cordylochernes scorpioides]
MDESLIETWTNIGKGLNFLGRLRIPRWLGLGGNTQGVQLHGFGDAYEDAYAAAVYIGIPTDDGVGCQHFREDVRSLPTLGAVRRTSKICGLAPILDDQGILGVGGRVAQMIDRAVHMRTMHGSVHLMLSTLGQKYWMLRVKDQMKRCIRECVTCCRYNRVTPGQLMSDLPKERSTLGKPFSISGEDCAGPVNLRMSKGRGRKTEKGYICLVVCYVTRAVHLRLFPDASTPTIMTAFKRVVARRGHCTRLYSDEGTGFVGAARQLRSSFYLAQDQLRELAAVLANDGTKWKTIFPNDDVNTLVLIKEERMPPARWLMGRVVETHPGKDGLVRVVSVRTSVGVLRRPLMKLVLLPVAPLDLDVWCSQGPVLRLWYNKLDKLYGTTGTSVALKKMVTDQSLGSSPYIFDVYFRVIFSNMVGLFWNCYLSMKANRICHHFK